VGFNEVTGKVFCLCLSTNEIVLIHKLFSKAVLARGWSTSVPLCSKTWLTQVCLWYTLLLFRIWWRASIQNWFVDGHWLVWL